MLWIPCHTFKMTTVDLFSWEINEVETKIKEKIQTKETTGEGGRMKRWVLLICPVASCLCLWKVALEQGCPHLPGGGGPEILI